MAVYCLVWFATFFNDVYCQRGYTSICGDTMIILLMAFCLLFPLAFISQLHNLYIFNMFGLLFTLVNLVFISYVAINNVVNENHLGELTSHTHLKKLPSFFGATLFSIDALGPLMDIRRSMS